MTRVAFVEGYYDSFAGAQQSMMYLLENLSSVHPILVTANHGRINDIALERGIDTAVVQTPPALDKFKGKLLEGPILDYAIRGVHYLRFQYRIARYLRQEAIDVLYCNNPRSLLLFAPAAKLLRIPVIWYVRNDAKGGYSGPQKLDKVAVRLADHLVCISDGVRDRFENHRVDERKFRTINTGVDGEEFDPDREYDDVGGLPEDSTTVVEVASIHPRKGQDILVEAMGRVDDDVDDVTLAFAGNVPEGQETFKSHLERRAKELGIAENVVFLGWCDDVARVLSQTDVFALPSYNEGLPRSILEALAMGVPVVATSAGGTEELVRDGETGHVVPIEDAEALGEALRDLCRDEGTRREMGERAREIAVEEYSVQAYVENFETLLNSIITDR
jgi:glycosyltransferase involved in cell wall biosynthesis